MISSHFCHDSDGSEHLPQIPTISKQAESSSETDDADREVAEMTQNVENSEKSGREATAALDREKHKLFAEMEESIAMLLEYGEHQAAKPPLSRRNLPREKDEFALGFAFKKACLSRSENSTPDRKVYAIEMDYGKAYGLREEMGRVIAPEVKRFEFPETLPRFGHIKNLVRFVAIWASTVEMQFFCEARDDETLKRDSHFLFAFGNATVTHGAVVPNQIWL
ncbi:unnamed protein product [Haemonchus placei]|uniref:tRNA(Ser) (uridine(44)-2'-O)-methyltransferase n=1 Tax=Haemonchus placei TaxID=6290 RepID=A0A0N4WY15_HAEPC|nr:unnamed protein product [Haemonchus placei]